MKYDASSNAMFVRALSYGLKSIPLLSSKLRELKLQRLFISSLAREQILGKPPLVMEIRYLLEGDTLLRLM